MSGQTVATFDDSQPGQPGSERSTPSLVLVLACQDPQSGGACFELAGIERIELGRAAATVARNKGPRALRIDVADNRMSARHAFIESTASGWQLRDAGSTNGSRLNNEPVDQAVLLDGDRLQLGHTLFVFRESGACAGNASTPSAALRTVNSAYGARLKRLERIAPTPIPVLLLGETGTGKEVLARAVHGLSARPGPMVAVNCGAIAKDLLLSQLFGHTKGAFSGADRDHLGFVRAAHGGTLFLDEIGELTPAAQVSLLRVLQEHEVVPLGATQPVPVQLRVVAATHQPLKARVDSGTFRADLYARIAGFVFELPPLRERLDDLGVLMASILDNNEHFHAAAKSGAETPLKLRLRPEVGLSLLDHAWPQNIRQLQQTLASASALCDDGVIRLQDLPDEFHKLARHKEPTRHPPSAAPALSPADSQLRLQLVEALKQSGGNVSAAARELGKARQQVQRWIRRLAIHQDEYLGM